MKYYNSERESHLQWSDYVSGSREPMLWFCSFNPELTKVAFLSVRPLSHLQLKQH